MRDLVSVLMCVYNTPLAFLKEAVESIFNQTYDNLEFIIVDDASDAPDVVEYLDSTDKTDERVILVRNKTNQGLTKSLNIGLSRCNGDYIARMDSDDISLPDRISRQVDYLEKNEDVVLVGSNIISFGDHISESDKGPIYDICDDPEIYRIYSLLEHSGPPHPTFMFRKGFLHDNGIEYREDIKKAQDYGIMADVLKTGGKIIKIKEPLLKYRVHDGQITHQSETEQKAYQCRVSYDFVKAVFPELTDGECASISVLGCSTQPDELLAAIRGDESLFQTCGFIVDHIEEIKRPAVFIKSIKKIIRNNEIKHIYIGSMLEMVLRYEWWKKALRTSKYQHTLWGMTLYTVLSYRYVRMMSKQVG